jgi:membrane protease YdiL (CAAX protease family)
MRLDWSQMMAAESPDPQNKLRRARNVLPMLVLTCMVIIAAALVVNVAFGSRPLLQTAIERAPIFVQITYGTAIGAGLSAPVFAAVLLVPALWRVRRFLLDFADNIKLDGFNPLWMSLCAGIGEEILFRGAIQPLLGLWWTGLIFALAHVRPPQWRSAPRNALLFVLSVYGGGLVAGTVYLKFGLIAAIAMHVAWDLVALLLLRGAASRDKRLGVTPT